MRRSYPFTFDFFSGALSAFDIRPTLLQENDPLSKGLSHDMQQLSNDQYALRLEDKEDIRESHPSPIQGP